MDYKEGVISDADIVELFRFYDRTGSGSLTHADIANAIYSLGIPGTAAQIDSALQAQPVAVNLDQFRVLVAHVRALVAKELQSLPTLFAVLDDDKDGLVSVATLRHYLMHIGDAMTAEQVDQLLRRKAQAQGPEQGVSDALNLEQFCALFTP